MILLFSLPEISPRTVTGTGYRSLSWVCQHLWTQLALHTYSGSWALPCCFSARIQTFIKLNVRRAGFSTAQGSDWEELHSGICCPSHSLQPPGSQRTGSQVRLKQELDSLTEGTTGNSTWTSKWADSWGACMRGVVVGGYQSVVQANCSRLVRNWCLFQYQNNSDHIQHSTKDYQGYFCFLINELNLSPRPSTLQFWKVFNNMNSAKSFR